MFTQAINTFINGVSDANENFVKTYFTQESVKDAALAVVGAQREFATATVEATQSYSDAVTAATKKVFKV